MKKMIVRAKDIATGAIVYGFYVETPSGFFIYGDDGKFIKIDPDSVERYVEGFSFPLFEGDMIEVIFIDQFSNRRSQILSAKIPDVYFRISQILSGGYHIVATKKIESNMEDKE